MAQPPRWFTADHSNMICGMSYAKPFTSGRFFFIALLAAVAAIGASTPPAGAADQVAVAPNNACAIKSGQVWCWGDNSNGATGHDDYETWFWPRRVPGVQSGATQIDISGATSCAIVDGGMKCWGSNFWGQLGSGNSWPGATTTPTAVAGLSTGVSHISVSGRNACAVASGAIKCWGDGSNGALGDGIDHPYESRISYLPVDVVGLGAGAVATKVSTGGYGGTTCAVVDSAAKCWGSDHRELLGNGAAGDSLTPTTVSGLSSGVTDISVGTERACAIKSGEVYCWGAKRDAFGYDDVPVEATAFGSGASQVSTGYDFDCAIVAGVTVCAGLGRLGDGDIHTEFETVTVAPLSSGSTSVSTTSGLTCGMNAALHCWGWPELTDSLYWALDLSPTPVEEEFDVDPPVVSVGGPSTVTAEQPEFILDSDEPVDFQCSLNGDSFFNCDSVYAPYFQSIWNGAYSLTVRGIDYAGNASAEVTHNFTVAIPIPPAVDLPTTSFQPPLNTSPAPIPVKARLKLKRSKVLSGKVTVQSGPGLVLASCAHKARLKVAFGKTSIVKSVALELRSGRCEGSFRLKLPRRAVKRAVKVFASFDGNAQLRGYVTSKRAKPPKRRT